MKEANFLSSAEPGNTSTAIGKLMLTTLSAVAESERDLITRRTSDGRERAKNAGVRLGQSLNSPITRSKKSEGEKKPVSRVAFWREATVSAQTRSADCVEQTQSSLPRQW